MLGFFLKQGRVLLARLVPKTENGLLFVDFEQKISARFNRRGFDERARFYRAGQRVRIRNVISGALGRKGRIVAAFNDNRRDLAVLKAEKKDVAQGGGAAVFDARLDVPRFQNLA